MHNTRHQVKSIHTKEFLQWQIWEWVFTKQAPHFNFVKLVMSIRTLFTARFAVCIHTLTKHMNN